MKTPKNHPCNHPLWSNRNAESAFKEVLRCFWHKQYSGRVFEETSLWLLWYGLLEECL